ncbi:ABC transporter ATP-binding protein [Ramlibacter sp.]|uniref:ABC transporter ATP-binding protein n=1 Tax=Ramlibacter sp. TaxID=1917967 RepID=UPI003D0B2A6A
MTVAALSAEDISVRFGGVKALSGVSLTFEPGKVYGMIGPNGSGKTTLLNVLSGVVKPTEGRIRIAGEPPRATTPEAFFHGGISRTFQLIRLVETLTVWENVAAGVDHAGAAKAKSHAEQVDGAIDRLGLRKYAATKVGLLPYGLRRRVEIARAIARTPHVLLLDEPMAGMNNEERRDVAQSVRSVVSKDMAMVIVEHDVPLLVGLCDELIVLNFGQVIARGAPGETAALDVVRTAYLGEGHGSAA